MNTTLQEFSNSFGFIIFFLIGTLLFTMLFGDQVAFWFLLLVLMGQLLVNVDALKTLLGRLNA